MWIKARLTVTSPYKKIGIADNHKDFFMNHVEVPVTKRKQPVAHIVVKPVNEKLRRRIVYAVLAVLLVAVSFGSYLWIKRFTTPPQISVVKVGVLAAFTGGSSSMGYGEMKGIQLAKKQLGADNIELIQADSQCEPTVARAAVKRLIDQGVAAIIGDGCSSASVAALALANNSKVVMISPSASSPSLSIPDDYFFRVIPSDNYQAKFIAQAMRDKAIQTAAVLYTNEPYGSNMSRVFQERFETMGGRVVATAYSEPDVIDLSAQMQKLKDADPQAIFIAPNSVVTATAAIKIARTLGIPTPIYGADIMYDKTIISNAPIAAEGLTVSTFSTGTTLFKQLLFNQNQVAEQLYAAPQAYDAFETIYRAIAKGAITGEAIKNTLPSIDFTGMSGHIRFDQNGEVPGADYQYDLLQVRQGVFTNE